MWSKHSRHLQIRKFDRLQIPAAFGLFTSVIPLALAASFFISCKDAVKVSYYREALDHFFRFRCELVGACINTATRFCFCFKSPRNVFLATSVDSWWSSFSAILSYLFPLFRHLSRKTISPASKNKQYILLLRLARHSLYPPQVAGALPFCPPSWHQPGKRYSDSELYLKLAMWTFLVSPMIKESLFNCCHQNSPSQLPGQQFHTHKTATCLAL